MTEKTLLAAQRLDFAYGDRAVLHGAELALQAGDLVALVGPNGSGKTTLLKLLCGILQPQKGRVTWNGGNLTALPRRVVAQQIALVPQELNVPFAFTVAEIVGLGRTPHMRLLSGESSRDRLAVMQALELTETLGLADRFFGELSGGEQQRVALAMALAQIAGSLVERGAPSVLLLDEPTVHLDINHQIEILELILKLNRAHGLTVLATMHDLNLASLYFDRLVLLNGGVIITEGTPQAVLSKERVENVFHTGVLVQPHPTLSHVPQIVLLPANGNGKHG